MTDIIPTKKNDATTHSSSSSTVNSALWAVPPAGADNRPLARILISEDNTGIQQIYMTLLPRYGFELLATPGGDGYTTVDMCQKYTPDLVITDVNKPGLNGHEICHALQTNQRTARIPVLFITAMDENLERQRGYTLCADDHIVKPFLFEQLLYHVSTLIRLPRGTQEHLTRSTLTLSGADFKHPITGIPGPSILESALPRLTDDTWTAISFTISGFDMLIRSYGRTTANDLLLKLAMTLNSALAQLKNADIVLAHTGYDTRLVLIGPTQALHDLSHHTHERFRKAVDRMQSISNRSNHSDSNQKTPYPELIIRQLSNFAEPITHMSELLRALDKMPAV